MVIALNMNNINFITAKEIAVQLNCALSTIYSLAKRQILPAYRIGGLLRFNPDEVLSFIKSQKISHCPSPIPPPTGKKSDIDSIIRKSIDSVLKPKYNSCKGDQTKYMPEKGGENGAF